MVTFLRAPCDHIAISNVAIQKVSKPCEKWILAATILGSSMAFIDGTVVNVAMPAFQQALHASVSQIQWVVEAYALTLSALLLVGGASGDLYGRRLVFLIGVVLFGVASLWCGLVASISQLIIARTIQGIGAALLVPGSLALISACFPEARRGKAIGTWSGFTAITTAAGPVLGGWLVEHVSWRAIFFINLPIAIAVFIITLYWVPESKNANSRSGLDVSGALFATLALAAIVFGLIEWDGSTFIIFIEIIGFCALAGFLYIEAHSASPMVPLNLFSSRNFSGANLITFFLYAALYGMFFFFPLSLIQIQGYTATEAGAALSPFILLLFFLSTWAGGLVEKFGPRLPLVIGPTISALGFALFLRSGIGGSYWIHFFPAVVVLGLGMAVSVAPLTTVVMNSVTQDYVGTASGINNAVARIAALLAIAVFGLIMTTLFNQQLMRGLKTSSLPVLVQQDILNQHSQLAAIKTNDEEAHGLVQTAFVSGYTTILWIALTLSLTSSLSAVIFIRPQKIINTLKM